MNTKDFTSRTSVRSFTDRKLTEKEIETLIEVINNSPTAVNAQQFSTILITDQEIMDVVAKGNGQPHIASGAGVLVFVGDTTRNEHLSPLSDDEDVLGSVKIRATMDATIASAYAQDGLISMGFGSSYIGGLPRNSKILTKKLNLPDTAFLVVGLAFGEPKDLAAFKPKVNKVYLNEYNKEQAINEMDEYNKGIREYYKGRGMDRDLSDQLKSEANPESGMGKGFVASNKYNKEINKRFKK